MRIRVKDIECRQSNTEIRLFKAFDPYYDCSMWKWWSTYYGNSQSFPDICLGSSNWNEEKPHSIEFVKFMLMQAFQDCEEYYGKI